MEVVSVSAGVGVGEVLGTNQNSNSQSSFQSNHHSLRSCLQPHQDRVEDDEEEFEDDVRMDTEEEGNEEASSSSPQPPAEDRSCLDEDSAEDQMDFEDSSSRAFLEDEDSSSRAFNEDGGGSSPTISLPKPNRKNKRKNFQPRNIVYFADSDEEANEGGADDLKSTVPQSSRRGNEEEIPLDLSEAPVRRSLLPRRLEDLTGDAPLDAEMPRFMGGLDFASNPQDSRMFAEQAMRRLLGLCGLQENLHSSSFLSGKLLENLKNNGGASLEGNTSSASGEPPTPPHTPQREGLQGLGSLQDLHARNPQNFDSVNQQALHARLLGERNFSTLLTLAALQEGNSGGSGVPLPPTLDPNKSFPNTPTTPTSTAVTPGLANLSLRNGGSTPPSMVSGMGVREHLNKQSVDYTRYVKRFLSALECGSPTCRELNHREHFHCLDCNSKVFSKKEEMIRHFKWHKKRDESLQHGFMRYSPTDDCSDKFSNCSHNRKQTHYHCLKESCDKVYISTSDVQMHANYHRKDSAIMQEGFQRFRASENCNHLSCSFVGQRTTHFHCIRNNCNFTFKNKADMEKHKTYHIKDEQLTKDGFKKFMKHEDCGYDGCKLSKVTNHIHCIRPDCNYVLHSSGQIFAHKRKHERQEHEKAYRKYKLAQTMLGVPEPHPALTPLLHEALRPLGSLNNHMMFNNDMRSDEPTSPSESPQGSSGIGSRSQLGRPGPAGFFMGGFPPSGLDSQHPLARLLGVPPPAAHSLFPGVVTSTSSTPTSTSSGPASPVDLTLPVGSGDEREWERYVKYYGRDDSCRSGCELAGMEHWHCEECEALFHTIDSAREHGRVHEQQIAITEENYTRVSPEESSRSCSSDCQIQDQAEHFHCNWDGCGEAILAVGDKPFRRLEHFRIHDFARRLPGGVNQHGSVGGPGVASVTSIDAMFKRKRGRPPKNRIIELPVSNSHDSPQAIFTSFKLPKSSPPPPNSMSGSNLSSNSLLGLIPPGMSPLGHLAHMGRDIALPGRSVSLPGLPSLSLLGNKSAFMLPLNEPVQSNPSQPQAEIVDGFYVWTEGVVCSDQLCSHLGRRHYHCVHPRCLYVSGNSESLLSHTHDFHDSTPIPEGFIFIDSNINCRMSSCPSNNICKHFHCTKCNFTFTRHDLMESHAEKHQLERENFSTHSLGPLSPIYLQKPRPDSPMDTPSSNLTSSPIENMDTPSKSQSTVPVVKSSGIFYPLSPFPNGPQGSTKTSPSTINSEPGALIAAIPPSASRTSTQPTFTLPVSGSLTITATRHSPGLPPSYMSTMKEESMEQDETDDNNKSIEDVSIEHIADEHSSNQDNTCGSPTPQSSMSPMNDKNSSEFSMGDHSFKYGQEISCGRPFCKLKKKEHFHCQICNQAFSEQEKLKPHLLKHMSGFSQLNSSENTEQSDSLKDEDIQEIDDDIKQSSDEIHRDRPFSPHSSNASIHSPNSLPIPGLPLSPSPRISIGNLTCPQPPHQFPSPLIYSQAAGFPGLPSPFGPHFGISNMFPGSLPRLLPPGAWPGVHPALAAMTHPHLMLPQVRPNGEIPSPISSSQLGSGLTSPNDHSSILSSSLNTSPHLALLGKRLGPDDFNMNEAKKIRASSSIRLLKDEPVPEGYIRFRFNEDCQYPHCGYREHQTHFHCMRKDCGYSFCDKTRFVQHTARHERLDTLMGGDFQQFRSNVPCGRSECVYSSMIGQQQNKASHFHCFKCDFVCTDTNKVVAHRRQHQKRDSINAAGFEKFTPSQPCSVQNCSHNQKQTHYHCLKCQYSVLGLSQMSAHKFRHLE